MLEVLDRVIASVKETPANLVKRGKLVDTKGCLCALGTYGYKTDPQFRSFVEEIRNGKYVSQKEFYSDESEALIEKVYDSVREVTNREFVNSIVKANDEKSLEHSNPDGYLDETDEERKQSIIQALSAMRAELVA